MTIANLVRISDLSFSFDIYYVIKQRNWDLKCGKKIGKPRIEDRIVIRRVNVGMLQSTGDVQGYSQTISSTRRLGVGTTNLFKFNMIENQLSVSETTVGHGDYFAAGGQHYPGVSQHQSTWSVDDGKLTIETTTKNFKVNPSSGEKVLVDSLSFKDVESAKLKFE